MTVAPLQAKWVAITGQASARAPAEDGGLTDRRLSDYLALPVSDYSLLDPEWVERYTCYVITAISPCPSFCW